MKYTYAVSGAGGVESFVPAVPFVNELRQRGFNIKETVEQIYSIVKHH